MYVICEGHTDFVILIKRLYKGDNMLIALIIIGILILLIITVFNLPVGLYLKFDGDYFIKIKVAGIKVYDIKPQQDIEEPESPDTESDKQANEQEEKLFDKLKKRHGFTGAVKELSTFILAILEKFKRNTDHLTLRKIDLNLIVASDNAATTAIEYGVVCSVVYPVLTFISTNIRTKMKHIDICSDFEAKEPSFKVAGEIRMNVFYLLVLLKEVLSEYNNFKLRNDLN